MKRVIAAAAMLLIIGTAVYEADGNDRMSAETSNRIGDSIREVIRAGVDPDQINTLTSRLEEYRFGEPFILRTHEIVLRAWKEKLPIDPIINKAYEGIAKRVAAGKTLLAIEAVHHRYSLAFYEARSITAENKQQQVLGKVIAEGLTAGIRDKDTIRISQDVRQQNRRITSEQKNDLALQCFQTVREMARLGVSSTTATDIVCLALQHQFTAREIAKMRESFATEAKYGKAENIAQQYGVQISGGARGAGLSVSGSAGQGSGHAGGGSGAGAGGGGGGGGGR